MPVSQQPTSDRPSTWRRRFVYVNYPGPRRITVTIIPVAIHPDVQDVQVSSVLRQFVEQTEPTLLRNGGQLSVLSQWDPALLPRRLRQEGITHITPEGCTLGPPKLSKKRQKP